LVWNTPIGKFGYRIGVGPNQAGAYFTVCAFIFTINEDITANI